jgi:hypothetical protein
VKQKYIQKIISFYCALTLFFSSLVTAQPASYTIFLPKDAALITQRFSSPDNQKTVILIQDAHASFEAQMHIAQSISALIPQISNGETPFIGIEGVSGEYDLKRLKNFPLKAPRDSVVAQSVKEGILVGAESALVTSDKDFLIYGLEDEALLQENYKAFYSLISGQNETRDFLDALESDLTRLKERVFNHELKKFDTRAVLYERGEESFHEYVHYMCNEIEARHLDLYAYTELCRYKEVLALYSTIDRATLQREIVTIESFMENVSEREMPAISDEAFDTYALGVIDAALKSDLDRAAYPNAQKIREYHAKYAALDIERLSDDVCRATQDLREAYAASEEEKRVIALSDTFIFLKDFLTLQISAEKLNQFSLPECSLSSFVARVREAAETCDVQVQTESAHTAKIEELFTIAVHFYECARAREAALFRNLVAYMDERGQTIGVLVAGGFHANGLIRLMKEANLSYCVVKPKIENPSADVPYLKRMMGEYAHPYFLPHLEMSASHITLTLRAMMNDFEYQDFLERIIGKMKVRSVLTRDDTLLSEPEIRAIIAELRAAGLKKNNELEYAEANSHYFFAQAIEALYDYGLFSELFSEIQGAAPETEKVRDLIHDKISALLDHSQYMYAYEDAMRDVFLSFLPEAPDENETALARVLPSVRFQAEFVGSVLTNIEKNQNLLCMLIEDETIVEHDILKLFLLENGVIRRLGDSVAYGDIYESTGALHTLALLADNELLTPEMFRDQAFLNRLVRGCLTHDKWHVKGDLVNVLSSLARIGVFSDNASLVSQVIERLMGIFHTDGSMRTGAQVVGILGYLTSRGFFDAARFEDEGMYTMIFKALLARTFGQPGASLSVIKALIENGFLTRHTLKRIGWVRDMVTLYDSSTVTLEIKRTILGVLIMLKNKGLVDARELAAFNVFDIARAVDVTRALEERRETIASLTSTVHLGVVTSAELEKKDVLSSLLSSKDFKSKKLVFEFLAKLAHEKIISARLIEEARLFERVSDMFFEFLARGLLDDDGGLSFQKNFVTFLTLLKNDGLFTADMATRLKLTDRFISFLFDDSENIYEQLNAVRVLSELAKEMLLDAPVRENETFQNIWERRERFSNKNKKVFFRMVREGFFDDVIFSDPRYVDFILSEVNTYDMEVNIEALKTLTYIETKVELPREIFAGRVNMKELELRLGAEARYEVKRNACIVLKGLVEKHMIDGPALEESVIIPYLFEVLGRQKLRSFMDEAFMAIAAIVKSDLLSAEYIKTYDIANQLFALSIESDGQNAFRAVEAYNHLRENAVLDEAFITETLFLDALVRQLEAEERDVTHLVHLLTIAQKLNFDLESIKSSNILQTLSVALTDQNFLNLRRESAHMLNAFAEKKIIDEECMAATELLDRLVMVIGDKNRVPNVRFASTEAFIKLYKQGLIDEATLENKKIISSLIEQLANKDATVQEDALHILELLILHDVLDKKRVDTYNVCSHFYSILKNVNQAQNGVRSFIGKGEAAYFIKTLTTKGFFRPLRMTDIDQWTVLYDSLSPSFHLSSDEVGATLELIKMRSLFTKTFTPRDMEIVRAFIVNQKQTDVEAVAIQNMMESLVYTQALDGEYLLEYVLEAVLSRRPQAGRLYSTLSAAEEHLVPLLAKTNAADRLFELIDSDYISPRFKFVLFKELIRNKNFTYEKAQELIYTLESDMREGRFNNDFETHVYLKRLPFLLAFLEAINHGEDFFYVVANLDYSDVDLRLDFEMEDFLCELFKTHIEIYDNVDAEDDYETYRYITIFNKLDGRIPDEIRRLIYLYAMQDEGRFLRIAAAKKLGELDAIDTRSIVNALLIAVDDVDARVVKNALKSLALIGDTDTITRLSEKLFDQPDMVEEYIFDDHSEVVAYTRPVSYDGLNSQGWKYSEKRAILNWKKEAIKDAIRIIKKRISNIRAKRAIEMKAIKDERLKDFFEWLKKHGLHKDFVVGGGGVRDAYTGKELNDFDINVIVSLSETEELSMMPSRALANQRVYNLARKKLEKLAKALGVSVERFLVSSSSVEPVYWNGIEIQYMGPVLLKNTKEEEVFLKRSLVSARKKNWREQLVLLSVDLFSILKRYALVTQYLSAIPEDENNLYSSNTGASMLQMAIDYKGKLYGRAKSLDDFDKGIARIAGDGFNFSMGGILRVMRLKHEHNLFITASDYRLITQTLHNYLVSPAPFPEYLEPVVRRQLTKVIEKAVDPDAAFQELDALGILQIVKDKLNIDAEEMFNKSAHYKKTPIDLAGYSAKTFDVDDGVGLWDSLADFFFNEDRESFKQTLSDYQSAKALDARCDERNAPIILIIDDSTTERFSESELQIMQALSRAARCASVRTSNAEAVKEAARDPRAILLFAGSTVPLSEIAGMNVPAASVLLGASKLENKETRHFVNNLQRRISIVRFDRILVALKAHAFQSEASLNLDELIPWGIIYDLPERIAAMLNDFELIELREPFRHAA